DGAFPHTRQHMRTARILATTPASTADSSLLKTPCIASTMVPLRAMGKPSGMPCRALSAGRKTSSGCGMLIGESCPDIGVTLPFMQSKEQRELAGSRLQVPPDIVWRVADRDNDRHTLKAFVVQSRTDGGGHILG